ncbi:MAG: hypothetical protein ACTHM6_04385 [Tepidisphaeraceae bacterium]
MICRGVIGRREAGFESGEGSHGGSACDCVDLNWQQTLRRALRLVSRGGRRVDVLLPPGGRLRHGDVLCEAPVPIAVCVEEIAVLSIQFVDAKQAGRLAFDLGNRHLPAQVTGDAILTPDDGPARALAQEHGLCWKIVPARFYPEPILLETFARR